MEWILTPVGWNLLFAGVLAIFAWGGGRWSVLRRRPKFLYGLWLLVLVKLVAPPLIALPILQPEVIPESAPVEWSPAPVVVPVILEQMPTEVVPAEPPPQFQWTDYFREPRFWLFVIVVGSLGVTLTLWGRTCFQIRRWQRLLDQVLQGEERFRKLAETAAERMGLKRIPEIQLVEGQLTPFLWTGRKSFSIVLPVSLTEQLTDEQVLCILMHELAHYRRRDHWGHAFAGFVTSLFWWNPVSWWAWRELRGLQEICCDALVLQFSAESRRLYAETLYTVLETLQTGKSVQPALSCSFGDSQHLRRRFTMLADTKLTPRLSPLTVCALLGIAALIPCLPTRAEPPAPEAGPIVTEHADPGTDPATARSDRFTIRMSVHTKPGPDGEGIQVDGPPDSGTKASFEELTLTVPALTVEGAQIAATTVNIPSVVKSEEGSGESDPRLSVTAKPSSTDDGKILLDLNLKLEPASRFAYNFYPPESPLTVEDGQPTKIVLIGPQDKPQQWVEIIVAKVKPLSMYQLHGTFHLESKSAEGVQHSSQDFNIITANGGSVTILLDQLKLAEVDPDISIPTFNLTLNSGKDSGIPTSFSGEMSVLSRKDFRQRTLSVKRDAPFPMTLGKWEKHVLEEGEGKPTFWLEMTVERVSDATRISSGYLPSALVPHPQLHVRIYSVPERFWIKPGGKWVSVAGFPKREDFQPIIDHITSNFAPESWSEKGGPAQYELLLIERKLVVFSTAEVHKQIGEYLESIQRAPAGKKQKHTLTLSLGLTGPGLSGFSAQSISHSSIVAHNLVTPTGKDPLGRPVATREDYEKIIATLKQIEPKSWESNGGKGKIEYSLLMGTIYFQNTSEVSARIHKHCSELMSKNPSAHPLPALPATGVIKPVSNEVPENRQRESSKLYAETYSVSDLIEISKDRDLTVHPLTSKDLEALAEEIQKNVAPSAWGKSGADGRIEPVEFDNQDGQKSIGLVIRQTQAVHLKVDEYLKEKRSLKAKQQQVPKE